MKRNLFLLIIFTFFTNLFLSAQSLENETDLKNVKYKINNVYYMPGGKTKPYALERSVTINKNIDFNTKEEFELYCANLEQLFINTRLLENVSITKEYLEEKDGLILVNISVICSDSKHLLALPKISYNSNDGAEIKVKLKDMNFLGFMEDFNFDFNALFKQEVETDPMELALGINFQYDFPFKMFNYFDNTWSNDFSFSWTIGDSLPEFNYTTGLTIALPLGENDLKFTVQQSAIRDEDYEIYGDDFYAKEYASLSYPIIIGKINNVTNVTYTPSFGFTYNWDTDGIDINNSDLSSPTISLSQSIATSRVDWISNFRTGYDLSISQSFGWNFQTQKFIPNLEIDTIFHKGFKYIGFSTRFIGIARLNDREKIGSYLRGIRDNQYLPGTTTYALKVPAALVFNFDMPVHIITTHWLDWGYKMFGSYEDMSKASKIIFYLPHKIFQYCDFELQLNPFIDAALIQHPVKDTTLKFEDGYYAGGLEVLIYPSKWKSFVVRTSVGFDLGRWIFPNKLDLTYRDTELPKYEIFFGLGLQY